MKDTGFHLMKGWGRTLFPLLVLLPFFASCSEEDNTVEEYPDWQNRNEQYFERQYLAHNATDIIPKWSTTSEGVLAHTDCILVDRIEESNETSSPYYNDTVCIHYAGRLIPSTSYADGYQFDKSFPGTTLDREVDKTCVLYNSTTQKYYIPQASSFIRGFTTALLHMHRGDHWRVTIPYQLGYGTSASGSIPAYSTLIFDIWLEDFWTKKRGDRY